MGHRDYKTTSIYADYEPKSHEAELVDAAFSEPAGIRPQAASPESSKSPSD
jgi:hypothetical protein